MKTIKFITTLALLILLAACGVPERASLTNLSNATPVKVLQLPAIGATAQATTMPDMAVATNVVRPTVAPADPNATPFVLIYELYGTPTPHSTGSSGVAVTSTPRTANQSTPVPSTPAPTTKAVQPTQPQPTKVAVQPTQAADVRPTLPPTATKAVTAQPTAPAGADAAVKGDPARGKSLFSSAGCSGCHDVSTGGTLVGPSMKGISTRAASRKPPLTAVEYLHESITKPNAFVVKGFTAGVMVQNYGQTLKDSQVDDLIAYLLSLK